MSGGGEVGRAQRQGQPDAFSPEAQMNPGDQAPPGTPMTGETLCRDCEGTGRLAGGEPCPTCGGTGRVIEGVSAGP
ncbi:MAG: hypothetical protein M3Q65_05210 [Chloroflexota bacterium]|nr:hypothetical protein [Chloroflexota bacterium]